MRRLVLIRHGETEWNAKHILQGQTDIGLSPTGRHQAAALAPFVQSLEPTLSFASDLRRACETAALIGLSPLELRPAWREADLGTWAGRSKDELVSEDALAYAEWRNGRYDPTGAERWDTLRARISGALEDLPEQDGTTVVVTHGGAIRAACSLLIDLPPDRIVPVDPGSITIFDVSGRPRLRAFNVTGDLSAVDPPD